MIIYHDNDSVRIIQKIKNTEIRSDDKMSEHEKEHGKLHEKSEHESKHVESEHGKSKKVDIEFIAQVVIIVVLSLLLVYNLGKLSIADKGQTSVLDGNPVSSVSVSGIDVIPKGEPKVYGKELGVKFDDVSPNDPKKADATIGVLSNLDKTITLEGDNLQRYIKIGSQISCEYCCGAASIIFSDGKPACGCAHSYSMRGLAKYLIKNHGKEFTDDQILEELGKWKVLFFPGVHETKAAVLKSKGIEINYINLASNKYRGIEKGQQSSGAMVGGC